MRLPDDDELYEVDQTYLGPPGRTVGPVRYKTLGAWIVIGPLLLLVMYKLVPMGFLTVGLTLIAVTKLAQKFADWSTTERPVTSVFSTAWNELTARRGETKTTRAAASGFADRVQPPRSVTRWMNKKAEEAS